MAQLASITPTTVGSFPRPRWLVEPAVNGTRVDLQFRVSEEYRREAQDDAVLLSIHEQEQAGLELVGDGEQRRTGFINHILAAWDGVDLSKRHGKGIRRRPDERLVPTVVGKIQRREQAAVEDLRFTKAHTDRPVKIDVPGPMTIVDTTFDEVYGDEVALAMDVAAALNQELRELQAAGADVLQIDEPAMTRWHEKVADHGAEALTRAVEGITVPTIVHLCYGYPGGTTSQHEYTYPELLDMLMGTPISGFSLEFARSNYPMEVLRHVKGRIVMLGCVDPGPSPVAPVADVVDCAKSALAYVDPENLWLAPDCGLMTISRDLARAKATLIVDAASAVRETLT